MPDYNIIIKCGSLSKSNLIGHINRFKIERVKERAAKVVPLTPDNLISERIEPQTTLYQQPLNLKKDLSHIYRDEEFGMSRPPSAGSVRSELRRGPEWSDYWEAFGRTEDRPHTADHL